MVMAQGAHTVELEVDNTKLRSELERVHQALAESDTTWGLLSMSRDKFQREWTRLHACIGMLKQEKSKIVMDHEADLAAERKKL
jgi:hypothetical protein